MEKDIEEIKTKENMSIKGLAELFIEEPPSLEILLMLSGEGPKTVEQIFGDVVDDVIHETKIRGLLDRLKKFYTIDIENNLVNITNYGQLLVTKMQNADKKMQKNVNFKCKFPRELLNEIKWTGHNISKCKIYYINRGSPDDTAIIEGDKIIDIDRVFLILEGVPYEVYIPYHRIIKIEYEDQTVFERKQKE